MTRITIYNDIDNEIVGFRADGHADYNLSGQDVLCAAVSTLVSHTIGAINEFTSDACENIVDEINAGVSFKLTADNPSRESKVLLNAFASSIDELAYSNPNHISITFKEV